MTKPDFEKAAKEYSDSRPDRWMTNETAFLAGCEHAYSIDKEAIERLEKENKELKAKIEDLLSAMYPPNLQQGC